jgi:hypothetical protein
MIALLGAIWAFLAALGPLLVAVGTAIVGIVAALWALVEITLVIATIWGVIELIFNPKGKDKLANLLSNIVRGGIDVAGTLVSDLAPSLSAIGSTVAANLMDNGNALHQQVLPLYQNFAKQVLDAQRAAFLAVGTSEPSNALDAAAQAYQTAFGFGLASATVTGAFEALLPEKLNTFNAFGPFFAQMASFEAVAENVAEPLYSNAFGKSAEYYYRGKFKPDYPDETDAVLWHARGLLTEQQLKDIFEVSGLKKIYEPAFLTSAYRGISPFVMIRLLETGVFTEAQTRDELTFGGLRPQSQNNMIAAGAYLAAEPYRAQCRAGLEAQYAAGILSEAEMIDQLDALRNTNDPDVLMVRRANILKTTAIFKEYETAYHDLAKAGVIDEQTYISDLNTLGLQPDQLSAKAAVLDAELKAAGLRQAQAAERALERQTLAIERKTAMQNYKSGVIDAAGLAVALAATGLTPIQVAAWTDFAVLQAKGSVRYLYGIQVTPAQAQELRGRVAAIMDQRKKLLLDDQQFLAQLSALNIPDTYQNYLLAQAAALTTPKSQITYVPVSTG